MSDPQSSRKRKGAPSLVDTYGHIVHKEGQEDLYGCNICCHLYGLLSKSTFYRHLRVVHREVEPVPDDTSSAEGEADHEGDLSGDDGAAHATAAEADSRLAELPIVQRQGTMMHEDLGIFATFRNPAAEAAENADEAAGPSDSDSNGILFAAQQV